jgi:hypothetical protein
MEELANRNEPPFSIVERVFKGDDTEWIKPIRLKSSGSAGLSGEPGDFIFNNEKIIGQRFKGFIGPWRLCAIRFKGSNLDLKSYNKTEKTRYEIVDGKFSHIYPDVSLDFAEILHKKQPDRGMDCSNMDGVEFLIYIPEINEWGVYFVAKKARDLTNVIPDCVKNFGRAIVFGSKRGPGKYNYHIPTAMISTDDVVWPVNFEEMFQKFLDTPIEAVEESTER